MILTQLSGDVILWSVANVGEQGVPGGSEGSGTGKVL